MKYRSEVDGLRAVAVVPVILFHQGLSIFSGGFVGVDVFFVISGYLITSLIAEDIEHDRFSIKSFYVRRARRILPALLLVLAVTYCVSWLLYLPSAHKVVGQYVVASIFGVSNILLFLKGNDYFGLEEEANPLFITWSLGVEEQFYLVFPIFLLIVWRLSRGKVLFFVILMASISVALCEWGWRNNPTANFYLAPTRAWELLAGSIVALIAKEQGIRNNNTELPFEPHTLSALGLILILISIFTYDSDTPFPSIYTAAPVIGASLVILFGDKTTFTGKLLGNRALVGIGLISYSAYLWHLPLKIFLDYLFGIDGMRHLFYFTLLAAFSYASYRFVETPFRRLQNVKAVLSIIFFAVLVLSSLGTLGHFNGGYPQRSALFQNLRTNNGLGLVCNGNTKIINSCSNSLAPEVAILGNSYAMTWVNSIVEKKSIPVVQLTQDSCAVGFIDKVDDLNSIPCDAFYRRSIEQILKSLSIKTVVISSPFEKETSDPLLERSFLNLLDQLKDKRIVVIGPTPYAPFNVGKCIVKKYLLYPNSSCDFEVSASHRKKIDKIHKLLSGRDGVDFIDITALVCPTGSCLMALSNQDSMYTDNGHLSFSGASIIYNKLNLNF